MSAPTTWSVEPYGGGWTVYASSDIEDDREALFYGPDAEARARAYHAWLTGPDWSTVGPQLVEALRRALVLARVVTVRQAIEAGDEAIDAAGLNPYALAEGLATGEERATDGWWAEKPLAAADALTRKEPR